MRPELVPPRPGDLTPADEEFFGRLEAFAYGQAPASSQLDDRTRALSHVAVLVGMGAYDEFARVLPTILSLGLAPEEAREVVYQAAAYVGTGRALPFLQTLNRVFSELGVHASAGPFLTNTPATRRQTGTAAQMELWGEGVADFYKKSDMNYLVCTHIFGDYYTRGCLSPADRALATFCFLYAMGGVDHELGGYVLGNLGVGNTVALLADVVRQNIVYVGFPRSLSAMSVLGNVTDKKED